MDRLRGASCMKWNLRPRCCRTSLKPRDQTKGECLRSPTEQGSRRSRHSAARSSGTKGRQQGSWVSLKTGHLDPGLREVAAQRISLCMTDKASVPFGGVCGWLGELTMPQAQKGERATYSYYVAENPPCVGATMPAIRAHAKAKEDTNHNPSARAFQGRDCGAQLKPGGVEPA